MVAIFSRSLCVNCGLGLKLTSSMISNKSISQLRVLGPEYFRKNSVSITGAYTLVPFDKSSAARYWQRMINGSSSFPRISRYLYSSPRWWWMIETYCPEDGNPRPASSKKSISFFHEKCPWILENEYQNSIINRAHDATKVNSCIKYEKDLLNIVGCRVVKKTDGRTERQTAQGTTIPYGPNWPRVKKLI